MIANLFAPSTPSAPSAPSATRQIRFTSLFANGRGLAFPCDAQGRVDMNALSDRARHNYLFARAMVGRDYARPRICQPGETPVDQAEAVDSAPEARKAPAQSLSFGVNADCPRLTLAE